jgi:hypothetical protein
MAKKDPVRGAEPMDDYLSSIVDSPRGRKIADALGAASLVSVGAIPIGAKYAMHKAEKDRAERDRKESNKERAIENQKEYGMKKGGKVFSASTRADGIAQRGKTKGRMV